MFFPRSILIGALIILISYILFNPAKIGNEVETVSLVVSLAANHGTISIRRNDGTVEDIGRVDGDEAYLELMKRLSLDSSRHPAFPHNSLEDLWDDYPRHLWRSIRKGLGLPASPDVATLSSMLRKLVKLFERSHNTSPFPIIISYAGLPALYQEDIEDAAEYLKLRTLRSYYVYPPQEMVAAYAGYGMGLCEDYTNRTNCRQEEKGLPTREVLLVEYTEAALLLQCQTLRDAHPLGESYLYISASFELGSGNSAERGDTSKIRTLVMQLLRKRYHTFRLPSKDITIIMTGSPKSVEDSEARRVIKDAAETFGFEVNILSTNPEYIAARGAAELAWRELILSKQKELWLGVSGDN